MHVIIILHSIWQIVTLAIVSDFIHIALYDGWMIIWKKFLRQKIREKTRKFHLLLGKVMSTFKKSKEYIITN